MDFVHAESPAEGEKKGEKMDILQITMIFLVFAVVWTINSIVWKIIETKLLLKRQNDMMDTLYSKAVRIFIQSFSELRKIITHGEDEKHD